ncbi:MAG: hypothetical protein J6B73_08940, partial [Methanobrevibacter sp.]|uniref:hypothetical protein n=1 Tax=Methanobrevibacter sp. TaxID=66852 RepID=UPI001B0CC40B
MRRKILTLFITILMVTSCFTLVSAENSTNEILTNENNNDDEESRIKDESERIGEVVESKEYGFVNVPFSDGYNGFCINLAQKETNAGEEFVVKNTSAAVNRNGDEIGNYLKILFVDYYDFTVNNPRQAQDIIWKFSDNYHVYDHEIVKGIMELAESGRIIPDHGEEKIINNTTKVKFDFEVLDSQKGSTQNFFGYKLTYSDIMNNILGNSSNNNENTIENETIPENNTTTENETIPENNTTTENETIPENNTTTE